MIRKRPVVTADGNDEMMTNVVTEYHVVDAFGRQPPMRLAEV